MSNGPFHVLMVCTANICRSPAAELLLKKQLNGFNVVVASAGVRAIDGNAADEKMQEVLQERGFDDISQHRSRLLLPSHTRKFQLILCMEREHLARIQGLNPSVLGRIKLLGHWDGQSEVEDPIGRSRQTYAASVDRMDALTSQWASKMIDMGFVS